MTPDGVSDPTYDLKSIALPRLAGRGLRAVAWLLENPATHWILIGRLLRDGGLSRIRNFQLDDPPSFLPVLPAGGAQSTRPNPEQPVAASRQPFIYKTVGDFAAAYRSGVTTPDTVAREALRAIAESDRGDQPLRAFIACDHEDVMAQARAATTRFQDDRPLGPLDGVPVAVKDEIDQLPYGTTLGTGFLGRRPAPADSTAVARMRSAGALLIGKTNMHEIGIGVTGLNVHHGTARNPHDTRHHTGGSSSGSAAAVAAGLCPVAIGADGGGSIRIPAALCGVVGLKPTFGRVSTFTSTPLCWSVAHLGPIATNVRDVALTYAALAGPDEKDPASLGQPPVRLDAAYDADLAGLTLGVYWPWFRHATPTVVHVCEQLLGRLEAAGARIREVAIPELDATRLSQVVTIISEMSAALKNYHEEYGRQYSPEVRINLSIAHALTSEDYVQAQRIRTRTVSHFARALAEVDAIMTPATGRTAPRIKSDSLSGGESDLSTLTDLMRFATPANVTGLPAISFPAGYDEDGLPVGMQAIGRAWEEDVLFRIAGAAEQMVERRKPRILYDLVPA